ncbi:MAG: PspC domain-containing protein [Gemmatimonadaceae bacterium]
MSYAAPSPDSPFPAAAPLTPVPRVWRSRSNKVLAGVLGGLAEKWGMQPTFVRVIFAMLSVCGAGFTGIVLYLLLWAIARPLDAPPNAGGRGSRPPRL